MQQPGLFSQTFSSNLRQQIIDRDCSVRCGGIENNGFRINTRISRSIGIFNIDSFVSIPRGKGEGF